MSSTFKVDALFAGTPQPLGPRGSLSSIIKAPVPHLTVHEDYTDEDEQANKKLHGGAEKVLHQFAPVHYSMLKEHYPTGQFNIGDIGENISVQGMEDSNVYIADIWKFGQVILQVSAPRAPCSKISQRFDIANLDRFLGQRGNTGWYYRVLQTGVIHTGDDVSLIHREENTVNVQTLMQCAHTKDDAVLASKLTQLDVIDDEWRDKCNRIVERKKKPLT